MQLTFYFCFSTSWSEVSASQGTEMTTDPAFQGVKFEPNSFKLTHEMVVLMGGRYSQGYQLFQLLTVKAFLAIRPHADQLVSTVQLMLDTCLPSFKGEPTIKRLQERFALSLNERQAAEFMMSIVRNAHENVRSTVYDEFQRVGPTALDAHTVADTLLSDSKWYSIQIGQHCTRFLSLACLAALRCTCGCSIDMRIASGR